MNLRKQVEPLKKAALQASSLQRHAHHAASRLTWVIRWLKRACRHHAQSRELKRLPEYYHQTGGFRTGDVPRLHTLAARLSMINGVRTLSRKFGELQESTLALSPHQPLGIWGLSRELGLRRQQQTVEHALELASPLCQLSASLARHVPAAKQLVGDVESGQHRQA
jgi:hypothetical protein